MAERRQINTRELIKIARQAQAKAYAPYSKFKVGAAILGKSGRVYQGCNVENASFGLSCCAERNAVFRGISQGDKEFLAIAVVSDSAGPTYPCGACRQVLSEFSPEITVIMPGKKKTITAKLRELLPIAFGPKSLK